MAEQKGIQELIGKAMVDADFRKQLAADPATAAKGMGVSLTDEQSAALKATDFGKLAQGLDERLSKKRPAFF